MIIVLRPDATDEQIRHIKERLEELGLAVHISKGKERTVLGAIGDERVLQEQPLAAFPGVEKVVPILKPYKLASREFHSEDTVININGVFVGGKRIHVVAGPCAVENREMLINIAKEIKGEGVCFLRGGAFKPRTSPYTFQGLGLEGLKYLAEAREETGLLVVTELMDPRDIEMVYKYTDVIQIGARNMQNFRLLTEIGSYDKPVILKRGLSATIKEFLMSAEYIMAKGNHNVILCERGIRTFETYTRNTLDLSAVPVLKQLSHLPVIVDPSHGVGKWDLVTPMARAGIAAGADGILVEVHPNPENALSDGEQSLKLPVFKEMMRQIRAIAHVMGREL
ncbi:MAG TPA: 3-deoxy-7-phosphoheptulonate synthase [Nitrospiraceae bacterium]|nr:3-deoxy-7-phosphoheptulonate synthase [Nitrospiraceae bacterium]